jgi:hypothetical protein
MAIIVHFYIPKDVYQKTNHDIPQTESSIEKRQIGKETLKIDCVFL